jgi:signal transduction histidine kinase
MLQQPIQEYPGPFEKKILNSKSHHPPTLKQPANMRSAAVLAFLFFCLSACSKLDNSTSHNAPKVLMILDSGWSFKTIPPSDPAYTSAKGTTVDPTKDVYTFLQQQPAPVVGWLHNMFVIPKSWPETNYSLTVLQSIASEIYLDGKPIAHYGTIDPSGITTREHDPLLTPIPVFIEPGSRHTLDVRIGLAQGTRYTKIFEFPNPLFKAEIKPTIDALNEYTRMHVIETGFLRLNVGINIMLFIVHFFFYILNRNQVANLFLSLSGLVYIIGYTLQLNYYLYTPHHTDRFILGNVIFFMFQLSNLSLFMAVHRFLGRKRDIFFWLLIITFPVAIYLNIGVYDKGWQMGGASYQILTSLCTLTVSIIELRRRKKGALVFAIGATVSLILFVLFASMGTFDSEAHFLRDLSVGRYLLFMFWWLSITASVSAYLAWDFSLTSNALKRKLKEVQDLSEKNVMAEKEKQSILANQNLELEAKVQARTSELSKSLQDLKAAQAQLIQAEKMASLGELTAGIAHEIQNPLNFVNNFSDINTELSDEIMEAAEKGDLEEVKAIAADIKDNQLRIVEHGKRADSIVKNMLQHSRTSSGSKEPTDLNKLADEYLRLAYHGFRAKDKNFNTDIKTDLDPNLPVVSVVAQDIGRVLLNLFNNAFYAVNERKKASGDEYSPQVSLTTCLENDNVILAISDNGPGIPDHIQEKVFQPFFTTKPTGQGTGLGLSLSYDIVNAHDGSIEVSSDTHKGTIFKILLPL